MSVRSSAWWAVWRDALPRSPWLRDAVAATVLTALTQVEVWTNDGVTAPLAGQAACFAVATLSVAGRRRAPLLALVSCAAALTAQTAALGEAPVAGGFVAVLALAYAVAAHATLRAALLGLSVLGLALAVEPVVREEARSVPDAVGNAAVFGLVWGAGRLARALRRRGAWWEGRAEDLERQREQQVSAALAEERQRIAREIHDVVAHSVSVMVLHAGAARQYLAIDPERATTPLLLVEDAGREALAEMQRLLQVLRHDGPEPESLTGLGQVEQLVDQVRRAGLEVRFEVRGVPRPVGAGLDLTAYRVLQEALTNALKHAPRASTRVEVLYGEHELLLSVVDAGGDAGTNRPPLVGGHGLLGMRERVTLYGGSLDVGPKKGGGFAVRARLPLVAARSTP